QHFLAVAERAVDEQRGVADIRAQALRVPLVPRRDILEVERVCLVHALEPDVLLRERDLDLLAKDLRIEDVLDADPDPRGLVRVRGTDATPRRADLQLSQSSLARLVDRDVPRHDQVRVPRHDDDGRIDAARLELVELRQEHLGIDDAPGADHARLAGDDPARNLTDLERLTVDDDRVPGVRSALIATHDVRLLRQQVDDLALSLVSPLSTHD